MKTSRPFPDLFSSFSNALTAVFLLFGTGITPLYAQLHDLYGVTSEGGANNFGTIIKVAANGGGLSKVYDFPTTPGGQPVDARLMQAANGKLYGTTGFGGANNAGVLFEYDPATQTYAALYHFDYPTGATPRGRLLEWSGKLYGLTHSGGSGDGGVLFEYDLNTQTYAALRHFQQFAGYDPHEPVGSLIELNGLFYGVASYGGSQGGGALFSFDPASQSFWTVHEFPSFPLTDGYWPQGGLAVMNGKLYGTTERGGDANDDGVLFEYDPALNSYQVLYAFDFLTGNFPRHELVAHNGILYGTTFQGGGIGAGVLYAYDPGADTYNVVQDFHPQWPGTDPSGLSVHGDVLYGTVSQAGNSNGGALYAYDINAASFQVVLGMGSSNVNANYPMGGLLEANGRFFGLTEYSLYEYTGSQWGGSYIPLANFMGPDRGQAPRGRLLGQAGKWFGLTEYGGLSGFGALYEFDPVTATQTVRHSFNNYTGARPGIGLTEAGGKLYGLAENSDYPPGGLFEYDPVTGNVQLRQFNFLTEGGYTRGALTLLNGKLYGATGSGGPGSRGALFEYDPAATSLTVKHVFAGANGGESGTPIVVGGKLYGMCYNGGANNHGVLYEYDPAANQYQILHHFQVNSGAFPNGELTCFNGKLYGLTPSSTGTGEYGVLFSYDLQTAAYTVRHWFAAAAGSYPNGSLCLLGGKLYGLTLYGGTGDQGVAFEFDPATDAYTVLGELNGANGSRPFYAQLAVLDPLNTDADGDGYTENDGDCNDHHALAYPGASEVCGNNLDDDCDGNVDNGCADLDLYGNNQPIPNGDATPDPADATDFGSLLTGSQPLVHTFTIQNAGESGLFIYNIGLSGPGAAYFTLQAPSFPIQLWNQNNSTFDIAFNPTTPGVHTATVTISSNDPDENPYTFDIRGTGLACTAPLPAGTVYRWTNNGGDGLWNNPNNWRNTANAPGVPGAGHTAFFACYGLADATLNVNATLAKLVIDPSYPGVLHLGAQTLTLTQEMTVASAPQLDAGAGTVALGTGTAYNLAVNCPAPLNHLTINCNFLQPSQHLHVSGNFLLSALNSMGSPAAGVEIRVSGNLTNNDANGWTVSSSANRVFVSLVGVTDQTLDGAGAYSWLNVAKAGGNVLLNNDVSVVYGLNGTAAAAMLHNGGRLNLGATGATIVVDYAGTVENVAINCNSLTLLQHLNISGDLEVVSTSSITSTGVKRLKVIGNVVTQDLNGWNSLAYISLTGATDQSVSGPGLIPSLEINKTGGNVLMPDDLDLQHKGSLIGAGALVNAGGVFYTRGNATFNFTGTIDDLRLTTSGGARVITLNQDLQVNNTLTLAGEGAGFRMTASPAGKKLKVGGNVSTQVFSWNTSTNAFISLTGSTDQTITTVGSGSLFKLDVNKTGGNVLMPADIWLYLNGELTGSGFFDNTGGVFRTLSGATFNFGGSIEDLQLATNSATVTLKQDLNVSNSLTLDAAPGAFTLNANPAGKTLKVNGDVTTAVTNWSAYSANNAYISLRGSADQTISGTGKLHRFDFAKPGGNALFSTASVKTFSGAAQVTAGNWDLLGNTFSSTGGFTASGTGKLTGAGTLTGNVTVASGGGIAPGSPTGCMSITGNLGFQAGATYAVDLNGATTACTDFDQINVGGTVAYAGTLQAGFGYTPAMGATYLIANVTGTKTGNFAPVVVVTPNNIACSFAPATGILTVTSVSAQGPAETRAGADISAEPETKSADETAGLQLRLYPNPVSELVYIEMTGTTELQKADLMLYDQTGRLAYHKTFDGVMEQTAQINLREAGLKYGVYTVVLRMEEQAVAKRLVFMGQD